MNQVKLIYITILLLANSLWALGEKPTTFMENTLDTFSHVQYHALTVTITNNLAASGNKEVLRTLLTDCRHTEFPVNLVFLTTSVENTPILAKALQSAKIQAWYVVTQCAQLQPLAEILVSQNTELTGLVLLSNEPLPSIVKALEDTKIVLAQRKSDLRLGCQIIRNTDEDMYQIFNTINLAIIPTQVTDPLAIIQNIGPILNYASEVKTISYIQLTNTTLLKQSTPAQLNKYISFLNSVIETKKYKGLVLSAEELDSIWQNRSNRRN
jgi:hypothetical protein